MNYKTIIFDFDGVLCQDRFFAKTLLPDQADLYNKIQELIFGNKELVRKWCRNDVTASDIVQMIVDQTNLDFDLVEDYLYESVRMMELVPEVFALAKQLKAMRMKLALVTDNMDVFSEIVVETHQLHDVFDAIINSADYGLVKRDNDGELFEIAHDMLGSSFEESLLIDDSVKTNQLYERKGGHAFLYENNLAELITFLAV